MQPGAFDGTCASSAPDGRGCRLVIADRVPEFSAAPRVMLLDDCDLLLSAPCPAGQLRLAKRTYREE
jgi:hypothetical protein